MEMELVTEGSLEEDTFGIDDNNDDSTFEGERCGICMDVVIDRGVLDCCQHWFCFACIDNWATVTNLCPLCQNEFQLITCVPVYDTIGSNNADDDLHSREDDWCIEGKNNTLSFPSYYIDENAVICLDGDGCKIRSRSATIEEDSNLDTSIACDSCDMWYHAFCVGFDPEGTCENSWLCPRCVDDEMPQKSNGLPVHGSENASSECLVEDTDTFSGKVSVSIADAGETAVVVSLVEGKQRTGECSRNFLSSLDVFKELKVDTPQHTPGANSCDMSSLDIFKDTKDTKNDTLLSSCADNHELKKPSGEWSSVESNSRTQELELSLSKVTSFKELHNQETSRQSAFDGFGVSSSKSRDELCNNESHGLDLHLGLSVSPYMSDKTSNNLAEDQIGGDMQQKHSSGESLVPTDKAIPDKKENVVESAGAKRKCRDLRGVENGETKAKIGANVSAKKVKAEGKNQLLHSKDQEEKSASQEPQKSPRLTAAHKDDKLTSQSDKENLTIGIMDIVHGTYNRPLKRSARSNLADTFSRKREKAAGLRVKKIMRRSTEDKESSLLVQKLRKEIRDAVRNKSSEELGDNLYDPKLLAAFRAVVAKPVTETKIPPPLDVRAKKSLLQKGKIRESLTKKIYGIGGRRKRAWTRDCEIEFWKHRCLKVGKPEKIETLKSVLSLLRTNCESSERKQGSGPTSSILSRLYLADASVFPRKDDIKPLSALKDTKQNEECASQTSVLSSQPIIVPSVDNIGTKSNNVSVKSEASSIKVHPSGSTLGGSKVKSEKETGKSGDIRSDKRKWALQVLARKTAVTGKNAAQEQEVAGLKGNYPFLAQLPADMRPDLAPSRHNKIPVSVRQAQLHRLTEHFLKKANTPVTRRTAEIELAVADAVNIEKEVANRSSSKLVYVNLCSQELLRRSDDITSDKVLESNPNPNPDPAVPDDKLNEVSSDLSSCLDVDEALRNAGLLSDSPPNSPYHGKDEIDKVGPSNIKEDGHDNVFEIDSQPELDIYGDFEYDLEDDDFIGASALKISDQIPEESKMRVLFSTLDSDRSNGAQESEDPQKQAVLEEPKGPSTDTSIVSSSTDQKRDECSLQNPLPDEGDEPSFAECEELYGPDKEPLINRFPESASIQPSELIPEKVYQGDNEERGASKEAESTAVVHCSSGRKDSPNSSKKNASRKDKTSNIDSSKKSDDCNPVRKKVEVYIKEHIRPLCKSGVITVDQYRWAVGKTTDKIMKYHSKDTNANFLIKEGEKVKKLAEQYVETAQWEDCK